MAVVAHIGLRPQSVQQVGGYKGQRDAPRLLNDARSPAAAGAFAMVVECVPSDIARDITQSIEIPTIGIGAGADCDGQVLVTNDLLGLTSGYVPRHVKAYAELGSVLSSAVRQYCDEVQRGVFPDEGQSFT